MTLEPRKVKVSELLKDLDNREERIYRLADLYGIDTRYKRIDTIENLVYDEEEKRKKVLIEKNLIK